MSYNNKMIPRFKQAVNEADMILLSSDYIQEFPFSISKVINDKTGVVCRSFDKAFSYGVDITAFGSEDAILQNLNNRSIIFYNNSPTIKPERKKFSLAHELGHITLEHNFDDKSNYDIYEIEANFFAAQLLMPEQIINELRRRGLQITKENLIKWFGVSGQAAQKRLDTLQKIDYTHRSVDEKTMDNYIVKKFQNYINLVSPSSLKSSSIYDPYEEEAMQKERDSWF